MNFKIIKQAKVGKHTLAIIESDGIRFGEIRFDVCIRRGFWFLKYWSIIKTYVSYSHDEYNIQKYNAIRKFDKIVKDGKL